MTLSARSAKNNAKKNKTFYSSFVLLLFVVSFLFLGFVSAKDDADYFLTSSISKARSSQGFRTKEKALYHQKKKTKLARG